MLISAPDTGRLLENLAAIELVRRGDETYCYKTRDGKEVDLAVKKDLVVDRLIQVSFNTDNYKTKKRGLSALLKASEETGCKDLAILTWDYEAEESARYKVILYKPIWKWLIQK